MVVDDTGSSAEVLADGDAALLGGGGKVSLDSDGQPLVKLNALRKVGENGWMASVAADSASPGATVTAYLLQLRKQIFEGFGSLGIQAVVGEDNANICLTAVSRAVVDPGWALISAGAFTLYTKERPNVDFHNSSPALPGRRRVRGYAGV